ncbi:helix-turn-helix transcriptional regulator [Streptomyces sp. JJ66]|uniref:helix-turn-helix domain-containing protein n=1 Tax=Streptomyces sp. JJ66 TaxID=2803843 RepID=UPI001C57C7DC|nr:helix-turn-helix domain-containing protein [Streptomyces sp. JJ66]MBW1600920.1 helix-turn-helix transcriptional regulator [Streptomyces sp. JJ66]
MPEPTDIGTRLREVRKRRGLSQQNLAASSTVSLSLIRKLEQGEVTDTRMETVRRLAVALRVPTSQLLRRPEPQPHRAPEPWRGLQEAVTAPAVQPDGEPTVTGVAGALAEARAAHADKRLGDAAALLPGALRDAEALDGAEARGLQAQLLQIAGAMLTQTWQLSAAETALERALDAAPDRLRAASTVTTWTWLLTRQGRLAEARALAQRWADDTEPRLSRATPGEIAAWGWLLLQGQAAAIRDNRAGEAADMLRLASAAASVTGQVPLTVERLDPWSPVVVAYKACEKSVILDRPDEVLSAAEQLRGTGAGQVTDYHRHRLDVAKAHVMLRQPGAAVEVLAEVHAAAPEWLAQQRYARDIMADVVERRRTLTPQMRTLADAVGLPV